MISILVFVELRSHQKEDTDILLVYCFYKPVLALSELERFTDFLIDDDDYV